MNRFFVSKTAFLVLGLSAVFFSSCAARITGSMTVNGSAALSVNVSLEPRMTSLIRRLSAVEGAEGGNILDASAISASMSKAPGITSAAFRNTTPAAIDGSVQIAGINDFLSGTINSFINYKQESAGGRCTININRETGPALLALLSPDIIMYMEALMAPIVTGEDLSKAEYLREVTNFYNKPVSDEIAGSVIRASIDFPGIITNVKGGTFSGRRADFNIPLLDILVLETPVIYEVEWR